MSRIADVLKKAREESPALQRVQRDPDEGLRRIDEVQNPWSVEQRQDPAPSSSSSSSSVAAAPAPSEDGDAIERLLRKLFFSNQQGVPPVRRVLFATVDESRAGSDIAPLAAEALAAQVSGAVCLADLDPYRPTLHTRYPLDGKLSLAEAISSPGPLRGCTHRAPSIANLWLMAGRMPASDQRPAFHEAETQTRLRELLATFDYVLGFTAPVGATTDATLLGGMFDGVVLLVDASVTKSEAVRAAADVLQRAEVRLIGTIVN